VLWVFATCAVSPDAQLLAAAAAGHDLRALWGAQAVVSCWGGRMWLCARDGCSELCSGTWWWAEAAGSGWAQGIVGSCCTRPIKRAADSMTTGRLALEDPPGFSYGNAQNL